MPRKKPPGPGARTRPVSASSGRRTGESSPRRSAAGTASPRAERPESSPEIAPVTQAAIDPLEDLFARGLTDGLPVVPPTRERVQRAVEGAGRPADELIARVPPNYGRATVEKIAVNAVLAGCRPEYLPVVIAAVEAACDERFDLHGVSATTNAPAPLIVVNGPIRHALDINCGA